MGGSFDDSTAALRAGLLVAAGLGLVAMVLLASCRDGRSDGPPAAVTPPLKGTYPPDWPRPDYPRVAARIADVDVTIEIAADPESRRYGMMFVEEMPDDWGMLFLYPTRRPLSFWMRNTRIPLDIVFLAELEDGVRIINVHRHMQPHQESPGYPSLGECRMALELPGGWLERHGVDVGSILQLPSEILEWPAGGDPVYLPNIPEIPPPGS